MAALLFQKVRYKSLNALGFRKVTLDGLRNIYFTVLVVLVALTALIAGIQNNGADLLSTMLQVIFECAGKKVWAKTKILKFYSEWSVKYR